MEEHRTKDWFSVIYPEVKKLAHHQLRFEADHHLLNTTGLVHEAYIKLRKYAEDQQIAKAVFISMVVKAMRQILVDHARSENRQKRGGQYLHITQQDYLALETTPDEILAIHELMEQFKHLNERQYQVIEYWFFGGFKHQEIANILGISLVKSFSGKSIWRLSLAFLISVSSTKDKRILKRQARLPKFATSK